MSTPLQGTYYFLFDKNLLLCCQFQSAFLRMLCPSHDGLLQKNVPTISTFHCAIICWDDAGKSLRPSRLLNTEKSGNEDNKEGCRKGGKNENDCENNECTPVPLVCNRFSCGFDTGFCLALLLVVLRWLPIIGATCRRCLCPGHFFLCHFLTAFHGACES